MEFEFSEEENILRQQVRKLAKDKIAPLMDGVEDTKDMRRELHQIMAAQGLYSLFAPEEYGGAGIRSVPICIVREELSKISVQCDWTFTAGGLGTYGITLAGSEEQKRKYITRVAKGELLGCFALTDISGGSDVAGMSTKATRDGEYYVINGSKVFSSDASIADIWLVFARTDPAKGYKGISAFIVDPKTPGVENHEYPVMALGVLENQLIFTDCRVPAENLVGAEGEGWSICLGTLNVFRVTFAASALGIAEAALKESFKYAQERVAFGGPIIKLQAIQFKLADMATELEAARWLIYRAAYLRDKGVQRTIGNSSMAKLFTTEMCSRVTREAVQIHGGWGWTRGYKVEHLYRIATMYPVGEGTNEIQRLTIAREMMRAGSILD